MNCPNCGAPKKFEGQKFCESCGAELPAIQESGEQYVDPKPTGAPPKPYSRTGGLFDINRTYYILKEKYWDWGSGDILDEKNQKIGRMHRKIFSIRKRIELLEMDGTIAASIHSKLISARQAQTLLDPEENVLARIKKKIFSIFRPKFFLEDPEGNRWYEAQGKFMGWSFKVKDLSTGQIVAEIEKADRWRDVFLHGLLDFKDTYALKILDNATDRRILLGFVLSVDNVLHDR